jgi:hypothetical protein
MLHGRRPQREASRGRTPSRAEATPVPSLSLSLPSGDIMPMVRVNLIHWTRFFQSVETEEEEEKDWQRQPNHVRISALLLPDLFSDARGGYIYFLCGVWKRCWLAATCCFPSFLVIQEARTLEEYCLKINLFGWIFSRRNCLRSQRSTRAHHRAVKFAINKAA